MFFSKLTKVAPKVMPPVYFHEGYNRSLDRASFQLQNAIFCTVMYISIMYFWSTKDERVVLKVMPPVYFHESYNRYGVTIGLLDRASFQLQNTIFCTVKKK